MREKNTSERTHTTAILEVFKKLKCLKPPDPCLGIIGSFLVSVCFIFCFFYLDYRAVTRGFRSHGPLFVWVGLNRSSSSSSSLSSLSSSISSSSPPASPSPSPSLGENVLPGFLEDGGNSCDVFDGNWVWDDSYPLYQSTDCLFLDEGFRCSENGRPDSFYTKWRWQPKFCNLPRFNAKNMLEKLRNRRLVFVGDSIGRNQWESLLCMLSSAVTNKDSIYEVNGSPITKHTGFLVFKFKDYNCTVEYYRAPFLVLQSRAPAGVPDKVKTTLKLDRLDWTAMQSKGADVLIFNTGHWWNYEKTIRGGCYFQEGEEVKMEMTIESAYRKSIETVMKWIDTEVNMSRTQVFFRSYAPVHFRGGDWKTGGSCHLETLPDLLSTPVSPETYAMFEGVVNVLSGLSNKSEARKLNLLNVTHMTSQRRDGHSSLFYLRPDMGPVPLRRQDCSHWCLPGIPDTWNELLYALFLKSEHNLSQNSSQTSS